jgi:hypothetical protein
MMANYAFEFWFEEMPVGLFEAIPRAPGRYGYMPYRGPGHFDMQRKLKTGEPAVCYFLDGETEVSFTITGCPEYGVLEVSHVDAQKPA